MTITAQELAERQIGASDVAAIMGVDPWRQGEEVRRRILKLDPPEEISGNAVVFGRIMEDPILKMTEHIMGRPVEPVRGTWTMPERPWLTVHPDARIVGQREGIEAKNVGRQMQRFWGSEDSDHVPDPALVQSQVYLAVSGWDLWHVAAYFGGTELALFKIEPDAELFRMIFERVDEFWHVNVQENQPCPIDLKHRSAPALLKRMHKLISDKEVALGKELQHWADELVRARKDEKEAKLLQEWAKLQLIDVMKDAGIGRFEDGSHIERSLVSKKAHTVKATIYEVMRYKERE
jgi:putative phage-type endonuclease